MMCLLIKTSHNIYNDLQYFKYIEKHDILQ